MMRRTLTRLTFDPNPLMTSSAPNTYVGMMNILEMLMRTPLRKIRSKILLRSEPLSGKTSLLAIAQSPAGAQYLQNALGNPALKIVELDGADATKKRLVQLSHRNTLLFIDEAHLMYSDMGACNFLKNRIKCRVVLIGTANSSSSVSPATPFDVNNYYMAPTFAKDTELIAWAAASFCEGLNGKQDERMDEAVSRAVDSLLSLCGRRVGLAAFIGSKLVEQDLNGRGLFDEVGSSSWAPFHVKLNSIAVGALQASRVMNGLNGKPSTIGSRLLALVAVERLLPEGVFDAGISDHRQAFPQANLRMVALTDSARSGSESRFADSNSPLSLITKTSFFTAVHPLKSQLLVIGMHPRSIDPVLRTRLRAAREEAFRLPLVIDEPATALDALLMSISHVSLLDVLCPVPEKGATNKHDHLTKYRKNGMPLEVAGFQDALKDAMCSSLCATLGWRVDNVKRPQKEQIDVVLKGRNDKRFAVEILTDVSTNPTTLRKHIMRFADGYGTYMKNGNDAVVWAVVDNYGDGKIPVVNDQLTNMKMNDDTKKAFTDEGKRCPLVLSTSFHHGLFCWKCTVHEFDGSEWGQCAAFDLDLDGIRMRRKKTGVVQAQRLDPEVSDEKWMKYGQGDASATYEYDVRVTNGATYQVRCVSLPFTASVGDLLRDLKLNKNNATCSIPKYTVHNEAYAAHFRGGVNNANDVSSWHKKIDSETLLPFTTLKWPIEVVMKAE